MKILENKVLSSYKNVVDRDFVAIYVWLGSLGQAFTLLTVFTQRSLNSPLKALKNNGEV